MSVNQRGIINVMSFQFHVDIDKECILNYFQLLDIMRIETTLPREIKLDPYL